MRTRIIVALLCSIAGNAFGEGTSQRTSVDLYCETMTIAFVETAMSFRKYPMSQQQLKKFKKSEDEFIEGCKSMPVAGGITKLMSDMTIKEMQMISCLAMAEGISLAHVSQTEDRELYSQLAAKRSFFNASCSSNRKAFLSDLSKHGPTYVLKQRY